MDPLDPAGLRAFVRRDWGATAALDLRRRAEQPVALKVDLAIELYEAARATLPGWPSDEDRRADLAHHAHVRGILRRAASVRPR